MLTVYYQLSNSSAAEVWFHKLLVYLFIQSYTPKNIVLYFAPYNYFLIKKKSED